MKKCNGERNKKNIKKSCKTKQKKYKQLLFILYIAMVAEKKSYNRWVKVDPRDFNRKFEKFRVDNLVKVSKATEKLGITQAIYIKLKNGENVDVSTVKKLKQFFPDLKMA